MAEKKEDLFGNLTDQVTTNTSCSTIATPSTTITVTATSPHVEQELNFPSTVGSAAISTAIRTELQPSFKPKMIEEIVETVEKKGHMFEGLEIGMTWEEGFKFKLNVGPKRIIKTYSKMKDEE